MAKKNKAEQASYKVVLDGTTIREYTQEVHGDRAEEYAKEYAGKIGGKVI
jgi:hypothetical protein